MLLQYYCLRTYLINNILKMNLFIRKLKNIQKLCNKVDNIYV